MKTLFTLLVTILTFSSVQAKGIPIPVCFPCEKLTTVQELPESENLVGEDGGALNLGYMYKEYGAVFLPVWNTTGKYVLVNKAEDTYYELNDEELDTALAEAGVEKPSGNPLSLWRKIGGKVIFGVLIALMIWGQFGDDEDDK